MNSHHYSKTRFVPHLEQLEHRYAPATLVSPMKLTYQDFDGDNVVVAFSKPILNASNVNAIFGAGFVTGSNVTKQQMTQIDLTTIGAAASGLNITTIATISKTTGGDGFAALGQINATDIDLGNVTVDGDLGRVVAGDAITTTSGLKALSVASLGRYGMTTGAPSLLTSVLGAINVLRVRTDVREATIRSQGAGGRIGVATIGGSLIGGVGSSSGSIWGGDLGTIRIGGDVVGGAASQSGFIIGDRITSIALGGSLIAGENLGGKTLDSGAIRAIKDIGSILIRGNVFGNSTNFAYITAGGSATPTATKDVAIGSVRVLGRVERAKILAGYDTKAGAKDADAQIGTVFVGGDWIASSMAAGAVPGANSLYGDSDDAKMTGGVKDDGSINSQIKSVTIGGQVLGTVGGSDHFGFVAESIGIVRIGGALQPVNLGISNDNLSVGITSDFNVHEI